MFSTVKKISTMVIFLSVQACVGIQTVGPGPFDVQKTMQVTVGKEWTKYPFEPKTGLQGLTIDGVSLNSLTFGVNIKDGKALIYSSDPKTLVPRFRSDMTDSEAVEYIKDSLIYSGMKNVSLANLRPETFGIATGVRFDIAADTERGLNMSGTGKTVIHNGVLQLILYIAPTEYYYDLHIEEVNEILKSATLL